MDKPAPNRARRSVGWSFATLLGTLLVAPSAARESVAGPLRFGRPKASDEVREMLPFDQFSPQARWKIDSILDDHSLYRNLPTEVFRSDPDVYLFLLNEPQITVAVWQALGISDLRIQPHPQNPNYYIGDDGKGTQGSCEYVYRSPELHVLVCEGSYRGPLVPKPIRASLLLVLRSAYFRDQAEQVYVTHQLHAFVKLDSSGAEVVAKLTDPISTRMANHTFNQVTAFLGAMSRWMEQQPEWAHQLADQLPDVSSTQRQQLRDLADRTADKSRYHAMLRGPEGQGVRR
jgi:hypothetical protein